MEGMAMPSLEEPSSDAFSPRDAEVPKAVIAAVRQVMILQLEAHLIDTARGIDRENEREIDGLRRLRG